MGCPISSSEHAQIRASHATLASTGCTQDFCQAGRALHTDEPRIGENRTLLNVELEAQTFLQELHQEGVYANETAFQVRVERALEEIRAGAVGGLVRQDKSYAKIGGNWTQTTQELEFGVRRAWRNSRKCIMRSHCEELQLCDLRTVTSSKQMAAELMRGVVQAFNQGSIQPTVFVFPPRTIDGRGPMILNNQILQFAGYEADDGSVVGDPSSVELTTAIICSGWQPPKIKGKWDLLPLVTMAEGDRPYVAKLPANISKLVDIRHPQYFDQFERLDLKWVAFPALTRLGFDIGGVQYTATPFIGWFMDAEIGVRNLADRFRYNVLPDIVDALGLCEGKFKDGFEDFEDLEEYEKLAMLSRAQAELNYAVHWSFLRAKISMTDSLTASMKWCQYDDDFRQSHGYRLPADPYWLAPPQGSIVPLWHRGGAPNYQPKPMISRHVQDPIKAWAREKSRWLDTPISQSLKDGAEEGTILEPEVTLQIEIPKSESVVVKTSPEYEVPLVTIDKPILTSQGEPKRFIAIYYCSSGTIAEKLAIKLHKWMKTLSLNSPQVSLKPHVYPLNRLRISSLKANKIVLLVVSSTGQGEIPTNGTTFADLATTISKSSAQFQDNFHFAVFGNGDSRYSNTFNGAAVKLNDLMRQIGGIPTAGGLFKGDIAVEPVPLRALKVWCSKLELYVLHTSATYPSRPSPVVFNKYKKVPGVTITVEAIEDDWQAIAIQNAILVFDEHQEQLLSTLQEATLVASKPPLQGYEERSRLLTLTVGSETFEEMSCVQILPVNYSTKVTRALQALHIDGTTKIDQGFPEGDMEYARFLREFVDLQLPFLTLDWLTPFETASIEELTKEALGTMPVLETLERLSSVGLLPPDQTSTSLQRKILLDMPLLQIRTYSIASSHNYTNNITNNNQNTMHKVEIMVKTLPNGRFSSTFIQDSSLPATLTYRIVDSMCGPQIRKNYLAPFVIVATGAGFGPVRCLLQWRISITREAMAAGRPLPLFDSSISLFLGFREVDLDIVMDVLDDAKALFLVDVVEIVVSNPEKRRAYDVLIEYAEEVRDKLVEQKGMAFVCTSKVAAEGTRSVFECILGQNVEVALGQRYVEEVF